MYCLLAMSVNIAAIKWDVHRWSDKSDEQWTFFHQPIRTFRKERVSNTESVTKGHKQYPKKVNGFFRNKTNVETERRDVLLFVQKSQIRLYSVPLFSLRAAAKSQFLTR